MYTYIYMRVRSPSRAYPEATGGTPDTSICGNGNIGTGNMAKVYMHGKGPWNLWHGQGLRLPSSSQHGTEDIQLHNGWLILELVLLHLSETGYRAVWVS